MPFKWSGSLVNVTSTASLEDFSLPLPPKVYLRAAPPKPRIHAITLHDRLNQRKFAGEIIYKQFPSMP